jgi:hypothetical protein
MAGLMLGVAVQAAPSLAQTVPEQGVASQPDVTETTRCLRAALDEGGDGRACLPVLRAPCAAEAEGRPDCLARLTDGWSARARGLARRFEGMRPEAETRQLRTAIDTRLAQVTQRCAALETDPAAVAMSAPDCRLLGAALLAHLAEFHPERFITRPEERT